MTLVRWAWPRWLSDNSKNSKQYVAKFLMSSESINEQLNYPNDMPIIGNQLIADFYLLGIRNMLST
jgi:hypothetical protein